jgi:hypothetical protein
MDLFVVPTISFRLLYGLLILWHGRRQILWLGVTAHPTAEWMARQLTEACGWDRTPEYLARDHDSVYGEIFIRRLRAMGIRDRPIAPCSLWQNGHAERLIGSLRREWRELRSDQSCAYQLTWARSTKRFGWIPLRSGRSKGAEYWNTLTQFAMKRIPLSGYQLRPRVKSDCRPP